MWILRLDLHSFSYFGNWGERLKSIYLIYRELIILSYMVIIFHTTCDGRLSVFAFQRNWYRTDGEIRWKFIVPQRWNICSIRMGFRLSSDVSIYTVVHEEMQPSVNGEEIVQLFHSYIDVIIAFIDWHTDTLMLLHSIALAHYLSIELNHSILLMIATCV